jgi:hypothetical protein
MPKFVPSCSRRLTALAEGLVDNWLYAVLVTAGVLKRITPTDLRMLVGGIMDIVVN